MNLGESSTLDNPDLLLETWLAQEVGSIRERQLLEEIGKCSEACIRRIVSKKLSASGWGPPRREDIDDVCQSAHSKLMQELRHRQVEPSRGGKMQFLPYVSQIARNTCYEMIRRRNPVWVSFANKVRRRATRMPEFALWECGDGREVCGFRQDLGMEPGRDLERIRNAKSDLLRRRDPRQLTVEQLMNEILRASRAPLVFEAFVELVMEWNGMRDVRETSLAEQAAPDVALAETLRDPDPNPEQQMANEEFLKWLWAEICSLLPEHRAVVLLNLRDAAGGRLELFQLLGIVSLSGIAAALGMDALQFAELTRRLPLNDTEIAAMLKIDPDHVSDRRNSARLRLARRRQKFLEGKNDLAV
jgi:DNA-directed RNA polymerase specialized sigma24 family protein